MRRTIIAGKVAAAFLSIAALALMSMAQATTPNLPPGEVVTIEVSGSDFFIPRPANRTDQEGVARLIGTYDLAAHGNADLIGSTCTVVSATANNGESVHVGNHGLITSNGDAIQVGKTEDEPNVAKVVLSDRDLTLGPVINLFNIMEVDPNGKVATSVDYRVVIQCVGAEITTTTEETTSTTNPTTTTTDATTTTTSGTSTTTNGETTTTTESTTTTSPPSSSTSSSTTVPDTSTTTTEQTTSTTGGGTTSTTDQPTTSSPDTTVPSSTTTTDQLPWTGSDNMGEIVAGIALLVLGAAVMLSTRVYEAKHLDESS